MTPNGAKGTRSDLPDRVRRRRLGQLPGVRAGSPAPLRARLRDKSSLDLAYDGMAAEWEGSIRRTQELLGMPYVPPALMKQKQETRPLRLLVATCAEVAVYDR